MRAARGTVMAEVAMNFKGNSDVFFACRVGMFHRRSGKDRQWSPV